MTSSISRSGAALALRGRARRLSDLTVELTAPARMTPDFLIVGAQRCGTTSMFKTLVQHPGVARPFLRKGVHYFDKNHDHGPRWYRGHFPVEATSRIRRLGRRPLTGESSPYYMFHPWAGQRIIDELPDVRLLVLLRDPVERAYSSHSHESARGYETLSFEESIGAEPGRLAGERERMLAELGYESLHWQHHAYVTRGQYIEQLNALEQLVGRDRLCVVDSGDFFTDPAPVFAQICDFLGLPVAPGIAFEQHNARRRSPMADQLRDRLSAHFEPYDERLAQWWGDAPSWRR